MCGVHVMWVRGMGVCVHSVGVYMEWVCACMCGWVLEDFANSRYSIHSFMYVRNCNNTGTLAHTVAQAY